MASGDVLPFPVRGYQYRMMLPIYDADGDLVTGATGLDSEVSKDSGTFADCTNEATEIATSSGVYYLDLTATEMTAVAIAGITKTSSSGAKTTPWFILPRVLPTITTGTASAGAAGSITLVSPASTTAERYTGKLVGITSGTGSGQVRVVTAYSTGRVASVTPNWGTTPDATSVYAVLEPQSINPQMEAESLTADEIGDDIAARTLNANIVSAAAGALDSGTFATELIDEIQVGLATTAALSTVDGLVDQLIAALVSNLPEPTAPPAANDPLYVKLNFATALARNKITQTATTATLRNDADSATIATSTVSDASGTATRGEWS